MRYVWVIVTALVLVPVTTTGASVGDVLMIRDTTVPRYNIFAPPRAAVAALEKLGGVKIVAAWDALERAGAEMKDKVLLRGVDEKLTDIVDVLLAQMEGDGEPLAWTIRGGAIHLAPRGYAIAADSPRGGSTVARSRHTDGGAARRKTGCATAPARQPAASASPPSVDGWLRRSRESLGAVGGDIRPVDTLDEMRTVTVRPGQSIQAVLDRAVPGLIIKVRAGTYREALKCSRWSVANGRTTPGKPLVLISADGPQQAVIKPPDGTAAPTLFVNGLDNFQVRGFKIVGTAGFKGDNAPLKIISGKNILAADNEIVSTAEDVIKIGSSRGITILGNLLATGPTKGWKDGIPDNYLQDAAIDVVSTIEVAIRFNDFVGSVTDGVCMKAGTRDVYVGNNDFSGRYLACSLKLGGRGDSRRHRRPRWDDMIGHEAKDIVVRENVLGGHYHRHRVIMMIGGQESVIEKNCVVPENDAHFYRAKQATSSPWKGKEDDERPGWPAGTAGWYNTRDITIRDNRVGPHVLPPQVEMSRCLIDGKKVPQNAGFVEERNRRGTSADADFPCGRKAVAGAAATAAVPAFPGAQGFGADTPGGRGGRVIAVTSLAAEGPGTLRDALRARGKRIVVFHVGGTIRLTKDLAVTEPFITVAGQTAPGDGICLRGAGLRVRTHDVVIRHLRIRVGDHPIGGGPGNRDAIGVCSSTKKVYNVVIDHCSASWSMDECVSTWYAPTDITFQWCVISEALNDSLHEEGPHGYGPLFGIRGDLRVTMHHCLIAHFTRRHPRIENRGTGEDATTVDFRNNVVYNHGRGTFGIIGGRSKVNYIANTVKAGADSGDRPRDRLSVGGGKVYLEGNVLTAHPGGLVPPDERLRAAAPFETPPVTTRSAREAFRDVLGYAGATLPVRDVTDDRVAEEARTGTGRIIDSQEDVGGWADYAAGAAPPDSDGDGMPDAWERAHRLNPAVASDGTADYDGDVYTNVEEYLNGTDPRRFDTGEPLPQPEVRVQAGNDERRGPGARKLVEQRRERERQAALDPKTRSAFLAKARAARKDVAEFLGMRFVQVDACTFDMQRDDEKKWGPVKVTLSPYQIAAHEVTQKQWTIVMSTHPWSGRVYAKDDPACAASYVSWEECREFVDRLNACGGPWRYALPTEAQWECAAREGGGPLFGIKRIASDKDRTRLAAQTWSRENTIHAGQAHAHPVGRLKPTGWGLYDMTGNVHEWCLDNGGWWWWKKRKKLTDPVVPGGGMRVLRGKSFYRPLKGMLWYSATVHRPTYRSFETGMRLVRTRR